jgi:hypothetical protein
MMHVLGEDHWAIRSAKGIYDTFDSRENRHPTTRKGRRCGIQEEPLHVDHDQSACSHVQPHLMLVVRADLVQPGTSSGLHVFSGHIWFHNRSSPDSAFVRLTLGITSKGGRRNRSARPGVGQDRDKAFGWFIPLFKVVAICDHLCLLIRGQFEHEISREPSFVALNLLDITDPNHQI